MSDKSIKIHSLVGMSVVNKIGDFAPIKNVWLDRNGIANILLKFDSIKVNDFMIDPGKGRPMHPCIKLGY